MKEFQKQGSIEKAALRAGMSRNTAAKYLKSGKLPSEEAKERTWRTRPDGFAEDWPEIAARLKAAPELEAKTLFEDLCRRHPGRYEPGQLRTLPSWAMCRSGTRRTIRQRRRMTFAAASVAISTIA